MSTAPNPYYPQVDRSVDPKVTVHLQRIYPSLNDLNAAIRKLNTKVNGIQSGNSTTNTVVEQIAGSSSSPSTSSFIGQGTVNDRTGIAAYTLQSSDSGATVALGDSFPVTVGLNTSITAPFYCFISNFGPDTVTLSATGPQTVNGGATYPILKNQLVILTFQGAQWFATAYPIVPLDTPAVIHEVLVAYDDTTGLFTQVQLSLSDILGAPLSGASGALGGSLMTVGQTVTIAVAITGAAVGMVATTSPETYPGDGFVWDAYISAPDTVTVRLTAAIAATPTASVYDVRVIQ